MTFNSPKVQSPTCARLHRPRRRGTPLFDASVIFTSAPNRRWLTGNGFIDSAYRSNIPLHAPVAPPQSCEYCTLRFRFVGPPVTTRDGPPSKRSGFGKSGRRLVANEARVSPYGLLLFLESSVVRGIAKISQKILEELPLHDTTVIQCLDINAATRYVHRLVYIRG